MGLKHRSVAPKPGEPKRQIKNYLLDSRFQLKYTGMVVAVTVVVASILGVIAYYFSKGQTEAMLVQLYMQPDLNAETAAELQAWAQSEDRLVALYIVVAILFLTACLGITGILVTHRLVGPAYKIKLLLHNVQDGHLKVAGQLRKGDELRDVFVAFEEMVESLRVRQAEEVDLLDDALRRAKETGTPDEVLQIFQSVRDRMQAELD